MGRERTNTHTERKREQGGEERNADGTVEEDEDKQGQRKTVWHKTQVRILFGPLRERERGRMVPCWVKYSGPVPSKDAGSVSTVDSLAGHWNFTSHNWYECLFGSCSNIARLFSRRVESSGPFQDPAGRSSRQLSTRIFGAAPLPRNSVARVALSITQIGFLSRY